MNGAPIATIFPLLLRDTEYPLLSAEDSPSIAKLIGENEGGVVDGVGVGVFVDVIV